MAHSYQSALDENLLNRLKSVKVLMVGAGGIGCELIKNLMLTGFTNVELIDLDTIDVSNLNRQFLFRKEHVGKSKAKIAREGALLFNPNANVVAHHDSVMNSKYGIDFFKSFTLVMNALDNRAARNHVNRMCLAADVPLVESGTAGYLGQVTVIKKGLTECYECQPKPAQKTFPGCTIRNTPSELIHCIVWAKHLFNQLFGEEDPDQDVSPDTEDPEAAGEAGDKALKSAASADANASGGLKRVSTRLWAKETSYSAEKLFTKLFGNDIRYLLSMENLWKKRRPPVPLDWNTFTHSSAELDQGASDSNGTAGLRDQVVWSLSQCVHVFEQSLAALAAEFDAQGDGAMLAWDKDNVAHMDFVSAVANIRAHIFGIGLKAKFDIKAMAGNIIPAIATTNAVIAGLIVMEALKILSGRIDQCKTMYLNKMPNPKKKLIVPCVLDPPNPKCYVCSEKPEVTLVLNTETCTVKTFEEKIMKGALGMVAPDVEIDDGQGTILISSEEGETEENAGRFLAEFSIGSGARLKADDFLQDYNLVVNIVHSDKLDPAKEFDIIGSVADLQAKAAETAAGASNALPTVSEDNDDDMVILEEEEVVEAPAAAADRKRKASQLSDDGSGDVAVKKLKAPSSSSELEQADDDLVVL